MFDLISNLLSIFQCLFSVSGQTHRRDYSFGSILCCPPDLILENIWEQVSKRSFDDYSALVRIINANKEVALRMPGAVSPLLIHFCA